MKGLASKRATRDYALRLGPIDNFPRLANLLLRRQFLAKYRLEPAAAPDPLHKNRREGQRLSDIEFGHFGALHRNGC